MSEPIGARQFHETEGVEDWRVVGEGVCAYFRTGSFRSGARLVQAISELPGLDDHHPDVDLRFRGVTVRLIAVEPGYYGLTAAHLDLARRISELARNLGFAADPSLIYNVQVAIDAADGPALAPFWRAVLGYDDRGDDPGELIDPRGRGPLVYFQKLDAARPRQNRLHFDVWVPHDLAGSRLSAAVDAGGRIVRDDHAPSWTTVADAEGNRACICTWLTREDDPGAIK